MSRGRRYALLKEHLDQRQDTRWRASFSEIERILGFSLPNSARKYPAWWANQADSGPSQSQSWQKAGWSTEDLDLASERVTFVRNLKPSRLHFPTSVPVTKKSEGSALTVEQARIGLAKTFGVKPEAIEIKINI